MDSDYKELCEQSEWHFDWFRKEDEDPYFTANCVRFIGDWDPNIKIKDIWEQDTSANKSGASNQYKKLGVDYDNLYDEGHFDKKLNKDYQSLVDAAGLENARILIHNQHPGQMHPLHMDKTYGGGHWDYLGDTKQDVLGLLTVIADSQADGTDFVGNRYDDKSDIVVTHDGRQLHGKFKYIKERPRDLLPIVCKNLEFVVAEKKIISDLSIKISSPGITVIMGPNGSGKSVFINLLHGLIAPSEGIINFKNKTIDKQIRRRQAMVFQTPTILRRSVISNMLFVDSIDRVLEFERCKKILKIF